MKKYVFFAAVAAVALAACAKVETINTPTQESALSFGVYVPKSVQTKTGTAGLMNDALLQSTGFGIFAYHDDASAGKTAYNGAADGDLPNFMYNQAVTYASSAWSYSPVKYWPNEHGDQAESSVVDKLSFFAYAPYVASPVANSEGINAFTANNTQGDPKVTYKIAAKPEDNVDIVWAVAPASFSYVNANGGTTTVTEGMPFINLIKPKTGMTIPFVFKHATSKLELQVKGMFDEVPAADRDNDVNGSKDANTKITIASVTINGTFARSGVLNLNNTTTGAGIANWESKTWDVAPVAPATIGTSAIVVNSTNNLKTELIDAGDVVFANQPAGVTNAYQNLLNSDDYQFNLIPGDITSVVIDYYVTTNDPNLNKTYSRVQNQITCTFTTPLTIENNKAYSLKLSLGMTTVKVSATVAGWENEDAVVIDLPANVE